MINRVTLIGRLGGEPEIRALASGVTVAKFSLATSEVFRDKEGSLREEVQWHDIVLWRSLAERAQKQLRKGTLVYLEGKLTHRKWQAQDGRTQKVTEVTGSVLRVLADKPTGAAGG